MAVGQAPEERRQAPRDALPPHFGTLHARLHRRDQGSPITPLFRTIGRRTKRLTRAPLPRPTPTPWCVGAHAPPVLPPKSATTASAPPTSPPISKTAARSMRSNGWGFEGIHPLELSSDAIGVPVQPAHANVPMKTLARPAQSITTERPTTDREPPWNRKHRGRTKREIVRAVDWN